MAVTVHRFLEEFPEFKNTEYAVVKRKLEAAILRTNSTTFGDLTDQGVMYLCAHLIAISPVGEKVRLKKDMFETMYSRARQRLVREATIGVGRNT
jgi:hypothetical protein